MTSAFERLLADLSEAEVDYILVPVDDENIARPLQVLAGFGEGSATELRPDDFALEEGAIRVIEAFPLNIEGLITLKQESLRQKDQMDVTALRRIRREESETKG
jgi:hypothetical protein